MVKNPLANAGDVKDLSLIPGLGRSFEGLLGPVFFFLSLFFSIIRVNQDYFFFGEGNGTPLQYSCLENPMNGGAWWVAVYGVAQAEVT